MARADDPVPISAPAISPELKAVLDGGVPKDVHDLQAMQAHFRELAERVMPATVGVQYNRASGSGVIVSADGYVMTAGHVSGEPGGTATLILQNGDRIKAKTLGVNYGADSGLMKIIDAKGPFPFVELGTSSDLVPGEWCMATGHPGGFQPGRSAPVRIGRVLRVTDETLRTDCVLVGGDSGGPLFDMDGRVIGIHSRISSSTSGNMHVAVDTFRKTWDRLAKSESWGGRGAGSPNSAFFGVVADERSQAARIVRVYRDSAAEKMGIEVGDTIVELNGKAIDKFATLADMISAMKPKDALAVVVERDGKRVAIKGEMGRWGGGR